LFTPYYPGIIDASQLKSTRIQFTVPFANKFVSAEIFEYSWKYSEPKKGFLALPKVLKEGGKMLIWVYNRRGNNRALYFYEPLRSVVRHLSKPLVYKISYLPALVVHGINFFTHLFNEWGFNKTASRLPFSYYANFPFNMKLNDAFDVLATPKSNYYFVEEIRSWFSDARLSQIEAFEHPEAGITCVGNK